MAFSFAVAALIEGRVDAAWGRWVRPWTLLAWLFLTIGIALGSWWAYYELGWGGFWFWDPVENASFMPWLIAAALLHSAIVVEKREALKSWTILLAILAFGFSLIGTFIVRSGVLTSVHAFANDPERGVYILIITGDLHGRRADALRRAGAARWRPRASSPSSAAKARWWPTTCCWRSPTFVVFVGTIWPLVAEMIWDRKLSVGPPFFDAAFTPFMVALAIILPHRARCCRGSAAQIGKAVQPLWGALVLALAVGRAGLDGADRPVAAGAGGRRRWRSGWCAGAAIDLWTRTGRGAGLGARLGRLARLPRADWGKAVAHAGLGITIFGIAAMLAWQIEDIRVAQEGETFAVGAYEIDAGRGARGRRARTTSRPWPRCGVAPRRPRRSRRSSPKSAIYPVAGMPTTEAGDRQRRLPRPLPRDRRSAGGRRLGGAHLCQALRQLDLGGRHHHGAGRRPVA